MSDVGGEVIQALQEVLRIALIHDGIVHGLHEAAKTVNRGQALLCVLASEKCDDPMYKNFVYDLCSKHNVPIIKVDNDRRLGEWSGFSGTARNVVGCSCVVIRDYGEDSSALDVLKEYLRN